MTQSNERRSRISGMNVGMAVTALAGTLLLIFAVQSQAQTFTVLHTFTGADGAYPYGTLTMDRAGNFYGTTLEGGGCGGYCGTVFKLTHNNSSWVLSRLYSFQGGADGQFPMAGVTIGPDGSLYGATNVGGGGPCAPPTGGTGCGTIFNLRPPATACASVLCPWSETVLYRFAGGSDGAYPGFGNLVFDQAGNLYGTTEGDQYTNAAVVFKLTHSGGGWSKSNIYSFGTSGFLGSGVIFDARGNLYGTNAYGGNGYGSVYELLPSGSGWTESTLYEFDGNGYDPTGGVAFDQAGNLYGTTFNDGGRVYELSPSNGGWNYSLLYFFDQYEGSFSAPTLDGSGNVYGVLYFPSSVFKLTHSGGGWTETDLHDFNDVPDGTLPVGGVILDANGNLYGTASQGGGNGCSGFDGCGTIFEITP